MSIKGKFYIWMNAGASAVNHYWMRPAQNWTTDPHSASFFTEDIDAEDEASHARAYSDQHGLGEVFVRQATRELA